MGERTPLISGNWKMHKTSSESREFVLALIPLVSDNGYCEIAVCPPFTSLFEVAPLLENTNLTLGAQNCHFEEKGAYTGEVSPLMLKDAGCEYVIVGHSERRHYFDETDELVNKKIHSLYRHSLKPIVCVGETLEQRKAEKTTEVVTKQVKGCLDDLAVEKMKQTVIAYEPVWAIGTGVTATPEQAQEVHELIRRLLAEMFGEDVSAVVRIQYGGSVKPGTIEELMAQKDIDGALVGGASLEADSFSKIVNYRSQNPESRIQNPG